MKNITGLVCSSQRGKINFLLCKFSSSPRSTNDDTPQTLVTFEKNNSLYWNCILIKREINFSKEDVFLKAYKPSKFSIWNETFYFILRFNVYHLKNIPFKKVHFKFMSAWRFKAMLSAMPYLFEAEYSWTKS